ncbi:glycoside hydrolase family 95-like protein [Streptomyces sp. NPDC056210]|uniref:glycoside hydrolase family 95-like protein n=1 Tax=Streptomyces TaxID=1883 RepID=UPI001D0AA20B|nr:hypothetical protein [Streptomyces longhuiensis]UDM03372.1 hypothetical protein LGI35_36520 [Streptomyces longhuiensis]
MFRNSRMTENTMYVEGGNLTVESPLTAGQSVLDMMIQSHSGPVRVFPGASASWPDASVQGLRAQGAFLIDADRADGATRWVRVPRPARRSTWSTGSAGTSTYGTSRGDVCRTARRVSGAL